MTFFDPKEDVIDIEFTQFGKHVLSKGKWNPVYYAFFDDDIIYDSEYAGVTEGQNDIQSRITGSARAKNQYVFSGIETEIKKLMEVLPYGDNEKDKISLQATDDREYSLSYPLGRSDIGKEKYPAWSITFLKGELSSSLPYSTSSLGTVPRIQLFAKNVEFNTEVRNKSADTADISEKCLTGSTVESSLSQIGESADNMVEPSDLVFANKVYEDGTYINIVEDYLLMEMLEKNTPFDEKNVDIEVFLYENNLKTGKEVLTPLKFKKKKPSVVDGILIDETDEDRDQQAELTPDCVEYFFKVRVDDEIPEDVLCRAVKKRRDLGLYAPPVVCPEEFAPLPAPTDPCPPTTITCPPDIVEPECDDDDTEGEQ
jgi:hypothetical protein